jgi:hypothetical protein
VDNKTEKNKSKIKTNRNIEGYVDKQEIQEACSLLEIILSDNFQLPIAT